MQRNGAAPFFCFFLSEFFLSHCKFAIQNSVRFFILAPACFTRLQKCGYFNQRDNAESEMAPMRRKFTQPTSLGFMGRLR